MSDTVLPYKSPYTRFVGAKGIEKPKKPKSRKEIPAPDVGLRSPTPRRHSAFLAGTCF